MTIYLTYDNEPRQTVIYNASEFITALDGDLHIWVDGEQYTYLKPSFMAVVR